MTSPTSGRLEPIFARVLRARWPFVALYALLLVPSVHFAIRVEQHNSLDRLIVPGDPDHIARQEFEQVFGSGEFALLLAEADDPYAPAVLARVDGIERALPVANSLPLLRWNSGAGGVDSDHEHDGHSTPAARDVSGPV
jgi:hypothetical protein